MYKQRSAVAQRAFQMWREGFSFSDIARRFKITRQAAWCLVRRASERAGDEDSRAMMEKQRAAMRKCQRGKKERD